MTNSSCYNRRKSGQHQPRGRHFPSTSLTAGSRMHTVLSNDHGFWVSLLYTGPRVIGVGTGCADQLAGQCAPKGTLLRYCQRRTRSERPGFGSILSDGNVSGCAAIAKGERSASCSTPASGRTDVNIRHRLAAPFEMVGIILRKHIPRFVFFPLMKNPATATPGFSPPAPGTGDCSQDSETPESPETYSASSQLALPWSATPEPAPFRRAHRILPRR